MTILFIALVSAAIGTLLYAAASLFTGGSFIWWALTVVLVVASYAVAKLQNSQRFYEWRSRR